MKKLLLSLLTVSAFALTAQAQTEKGNFVIGGSAQFNSTKQDDYPKSDKGFYVAPNVGYFIADNIAIGTGIGFQSGKYYSYSSLNPATGYSIKSSTFIVSPFARAYKNINDQFKFFGQLAVPMSFGNSKMGDVNGENFTKNGKISSAGVSLSPGLAFFPSKKFGIEFAVSGISYNDNKSKDANGVQTQGNKSFNIGANFFSPSIGVQFYL